MSTNKSNPYTGDLATALISKFRSFGIPFEPTLRYFQRHGVTPIAKQLLFSLIKIDLELPTHVDQVDDFFNRLAELNPRFKPRPVPSASTERPRFLTLSSSGREYGRVDYSANATYYATLRLSDIEDDFIQYLLDNAEVEPDDDFFTCPEDIHDAFISFLKEYAQNNADGDIEDSDEHEVDWESSEIHETSCDGDWDLTSAIPYKTYAITSNEQEQSRARERGETVAADLTLWRRFLDKYRQAWDDQA